MINKRTVLITSMGMSPSVLTETVWSLAHQPSPIIPDEIVVIVAKNAADKIRNELLNGENPVWNRLLASFRKEKLEIDGKLAFGAASIHIIPDAQGDEMWDLRSSDDNLTAADFMLRQIRQYTETPDTELIVSIAGGRKTMSALLFSCMTLLGRDCDRIVHVLLPQELEGGSEPPFYFPEMRVSYTSLRSGKKIKSEKLRSELFEVPFVRMRGWYQDKFKSVPPTYRTLVSRVQMLAPPAVVYPDIEIDVWNGVVTMNGSMVQMSKPCFAMLVLLADGCTAREVHTRLLTLHSYKSSRMAMCDWLATFQESALFKCEDSVEDVFKTLSNLRKKLKEAGFENVETLVPQRNNPVVFPVNTIKWRNRDKVVDVCGCLFREIAP